MKIVGRVKETDEYWAVKCATGSTIVIPKDGRWKFDGNYEKPSFSPSVNETWGKEGQTLEDFRKDPNPNRNHVYVRNGMIEYLSDCTHSLAGQTVEIPPWSDANRKEGKLQHGGQNSTGIG